SSFGMGGTNAHIVLEEAPAAVGLVPRQDVWCIPVSARNAKSLASFADNLARHLEGHPSLDATDLWFTLSEGRRRFQERAVVLAESRMEAAAALRALRDGSGKQFPGREEFEGARAFARAWLTGEQSEASKLLPAGPHRRIPLPTYVFDREVYWVDR